MIPKNELDALVGGWETIPLAGSVSRRCSLPGCRRQAVVSFKKDGRGGFGCRFHQFGVEDFFSPSVARYAGYGREVPVPQVTFAAYDDRGNVVMENIVSLDKAMRQLRRRGRYSKLVAVIPTVRWWTGETPTEQDPRVIETPITIGWTDGETRFELVHPRIIWGDSFRLVRGRLEFASEHPGDERTEWLGSFVRDDEGGVA